MCAPTDFTLVPSLGSTTSNRTLEVPFISSILDTPFDFYRRETLGGGNCFFHALLASLSSIYRKSNKKEKERSAAVLRSIVANYSRQESLLNRRSSLRSYFPELENYPYTNWDNTNLPDLYYQELLSATDLYLQGELDAHNWHNLRSDLYSGVDYSPSGIYDFFQSSIEVGQEVFDLVSSALNVDIYIVALYSDNITPYYATATEESAATTVVIALTQGHYESIFFYDSSKDQTKTFLRPDRPSAQNTVESLKTFFNVGRKSALKKNPQILYWSELTNLILDREKRNYLLSDALDNISTSAFVFLNTAQSEPNFFYLYVANYLVNFLPQAYAFKFGLSEEEKSTLSSALGNLVSKLLSYFITR